jgi:hypothetical protein
MPGLGEHRHPVQAVVRCGAIRIDARIVGSSSWPPVVVWDTQVDALPCPDVRAKFQNRSRAVTGIALELQTADMRDGCSWHPLLTAIRFRDNSTNWRRAAAVIGFRDALNFLQAMG